MEERKEEYKKTYNEARQKASAQSSSLDSLAKENVSLKNNID
jgi:CHASE3 domain sensor protein